MRWGHLSPTKGGCPGGDRGQRDTWDRPERTGLGRNGGLEEDESAFLQDTDVTVRGKNTEALKEAEAEAAAEAETLNNEGKGFVPL